jgi:2-oxoglutarate dehydrogenase E1 component
LYRAETKRHDVAILRLEQLYPLHVEKLRSVLNLHPPGTTVVWVQEEPENMGAWRYLRAKFGATLFDSFPFSGVYRPASASPATGSASTHKKEQAHIIEAAFNREGQNNGD